jgi:MFS family permease
VATEPSTDHTLAAGSASPAAAAQAADGRGLPRDIYVLAIISLFVSIGFGIIGPAIPLLAKQFGVGAFEASLAISAFALFRFISAIGSGQLIGRLGERRVLVIGLMVQAVTSVLAGLAPTFELLLTFRAIGGLGSACFSISSMALLLRLAPPDRRGRAMAVYQGGNIMGAIIGPATGGVLADITPRLPLLVYGAFLLVAAAVGIAQLSTPPAQGDGPADSPAREPAANAAVDDADPDLADPHIEEALQYEDVEDNVAVNRPVHVEHIEPAGGTARNQSDFLRIYLTALLANLASGWVFYGMRNSLLPLFISDDLDKSAGWTGLAFFVAAIVQGLALLRTGWLADTVGRKFALVLGLLIGLGSLLVFMLPISAAVFLLPMMTFGVAAALMATAPAALLADVAHGRGGKVIAGFSMMSDFGAITGPLVSGWIADTWSYPTAFGASVVIIAIALVPAALLPSRRRMAAATR